MRLTSFRKVLNIGTSVKNVHWLPVWCSKKNLWGHFKSGCKCSRLDIMCVSDKWCMYCLDYNLEKGGDNLSVIKRINNVSVCVYVGRSEEVVCIMFPYSSHFLLPHMQFFEIEWLRLYLWENVLCATDCLIWTIMSIISCYPRKSS